MNMMDRPYWFRVFIGLDQFFNALFDGDPDETVSSRIGRRYISGSLSWRHPLEMFIFILLEKIDPGHCIRSIGV